MVFSFILQIICEFQVKATYHDDSPASLQPFEVCLNKIKKDQCKNMTSDEEGIINFILPIYSSYSVSISFSQDNSLIKSANQYVFLGKNSCYEFLTNSIFQVRSLKHGNIPNNFSDTQKLMRESNYYSTFPQNYHSPTNSSLYINHYDNFKCIKNGSANFNLEVLFVANDQESADIHVQVSIFNILRLSLEFILKSKLYSKIFLNSDRLL